jgi:hypothetical protein
MPTPTIYASQSGGSGGGSATGPASWTGSGHTLASGEPLVAAVFSTRSNYSSFSTGVTVSGWSLIGQGSETVVAGTGTTSFVMDCRFYSRTADGTSADDFNPTVGSAWYSTPPGGTPRSWTCFAFAFTDVVGGLSSPYTIATFPEGGGFSYTPSAITVNRGTSLGVVMFARRATGGAFTTANGWSSLSMEVTGRGSGGATGYKAQATAGAMTMPVIATGNAAAVSLSFAVSGIPYDAADWGVDQIKW